MLERESKYSCEINVLLKSNFFGEGILIIVEYLSLKSLLKRKQKLKKEDEKFQFFPNSKFSNQL